MLNPRGGADDLLLGSLGSLTLLGHMVALGTVNPVTRKRYLGDQYEPRTIRHSNAVIRAFYEYWIEDVGAGPLINPVQLARKPSTASPPNSSGASSKRTSKHASWNSVNAGVPMARPANMNTHAYGAQVFG